MDEPSHAPEWRWPANLKWKPYSRHPVMADVLPSRSHVNLVASILVILLKIANHLFAEEPMRKIVTLFQRNYETDRLVRDEVVPGAEWVLAGEGVATRKYDGTCCMVRGGSLYKRYDAQSGKPTPAGFEPAQEPNQETGHWPGWLPVGDGPEDRWFREAFSASPELVDGTYELCGPKVQGNPENCPNHVLIPHGKHVLVDCPRDFAGLREFLTACDFEGIVWHHPDGRMVKLKKRDFVKSGPKRRN